MIPAKVALHHEEQYHIILERALAKAKEKANITLKNIQLIAVSNAPGLGHSLRIGMAAAKSLALELGIPLIGVNHCVAHLEIANLVTKAKDPVLLYCSGANTQVIAYDAGKYRVFGETLDTGVGNFLDTFARDLGLGFPGGPKIEQLALNAIQQHNASTIQENANTQQNNATMQQNITTTQHTTIRESTITQHPTTQSQHSRPTLIPLPYSIKGMDVAFAGLQTHLLQKIKEGVAGGSYTKEDLAYSVQEHVFAMLVEVAERALAHVGKNELVLGGGVGCNKRLQEMCRIMCEERGATFFCPANEFLVDNAAMIAWTGKLMHEKGNIIIAIEELNIYPYERTDDVTVTWKE